MRIWARVFGTGPGPGLPLLPNSGQLPALVRTLPSTSHYHRLFPFLRIFIGFDPIDLSFKKKYGMQMAVMEKYFKDNLWYFDTFHDIHMDKTNPNQ